MIGSTLNVQFATWPSWVLCLRVWPDRDRFEERPLPPLEAQDEAAVREVTTMDTSYPGNPAPLAQRAQESVPIIRTIHLSDLREALRLGWEDFKAVPSH